VTAAQWVRGITTFPGLTRQVPASTGVSSRARSPPICRFKAAKALGLDVPPVLLARADRITLADFR